MSPLSLIGLAVVGKNNEPIYMCDCTRLSDEHGAGSSTNPASSSPAEEVNDVFGFLEGSQELGESLPIQHRFLVHAALDQVEELVVTTVGFATNAAGTRRYSGMPVRKNPMPSMGPHWLGVLLDLADEWQVHGYVTATNMKLFALTRRREPHVKVTPADGLKVRSLLERVHSLFIAYAMNPFQEMRDLKSIRSPRFDKGIRDAVRVYNAPPPS